MTTTTRKLTFEEYLTYDDSTVSTTAMTDVITTISYHSIFEF